MYGEQLTITMFLQINKQNECLRSSQNLAKSWTKKAIHKCLSEKYQSQRHIYRLLNYAPDGHCYILFWPSNTVVSSTANRSWPSRAKCRTKARPTLIAVYRADRFSILKAFLSSSIFSLATPITVASKFCDREICHCLMCTILMKGVR